MATATFVSVVAGASVGTPVRDGSRVDEVVAWPEGVPLRTMRELLGGVELR